MRQRGIVYPCIVRLDDQKPRRADWSKGEFLVKRALLLESE